MPKISDWLRETTKLLKEHDVTSARLDAEIILAHTLRKSRTWLHAHADETIEPRFRDIADARVDLRRDHVPIAYIIGHKEFYGRRFVVTPSVLVPRPDSEILIDLLKRHTNTAKLFAQPAQKLIDIGTGSGILGITAKLELPELDVTLADTSRHALTVAEKNARLLEGDVTTLRSNLLDSYPFSPDYIVANLPYVARHWEQGKEIAHEPTEALFAEQDGLALIFQLIDQAQNRLVKNGLLLLEADPRQHAAIIERATANSFNVLEHEAFGVALAKK